MADGAAQQAADARFMHMALTLARRGLGRTWPNPAVGCVLVTPTGQTAGRGWTQPGGRPHAETEALDRAGMAARGATAYVTLEPCSHHGKTPPCADALIDAGIGRVVVATSDPDPRVNGHGISRLRDAGIAVTLGPGAAEAQALNDGFFRRVSQGRPMVTLKLASTLDGRIATHSGASRWITGPAARARTHMLRAEHDAILIGSTTAIVDDPALTCRLPGLEHRSPVRVILDSRLRIPLTSTLVATAAAQPTWLITGAGNESTRIAAFRDAGVDVVLAPNRPIGRIDLAEALMALGARGITRLLVEGGAQIAASLLQADLVDRLEWFRAPSLVGGDGVPAVAPFGVDTMDQLARFDRFETHRLGDDIWERLRRPASVGAGLKKSSDRHRSGEATPSSK